MISLATALVMLTSGLDPAIGQCPPGMVLDSHTQTPVEGGIMHNWHCTALNQLGQMGTGQTDTGTGFDGGVGPTSAVATAKLREVMPEITPEQIQQYSSNPAFRAAAGELAKASESVKQAQAAVDSLRERQTAASTAAEKQRLQIDIMRAEQQRQAARGAERIATMRAKKVIRELPVVVE